MCQLLLPFHPIASYCQHRELMLTVNGVFSHLEYISIQDILPCELAMDLTRQVVLHREPLTPNEALWEIKDVQHHWQVPLHLPEDLVGAPMSSTGGRETQSFLSIGIPATSALPRLLETLYPSWACSRSHHSFHNITNMILFAQVSLQTWHLPYMNKWYKQKRYERTRCSHHLCMNVFHSLNQRVPATFSEVGSVWLIVKTSSSYNPL